MKIEIEITGAQRSVMDELFNPFVKASSQLGEGIVSVYNVRASNDVELYVIHPDGRYFKEVLDGAGGVWERYDESGEPTELPHWAVA